MKTIKILFTLVVFVMMGLTVSAQTKKDTTVIFKVGIHCPSCKAKLDKDMPFEKGIKDDITGFLPIQLMTVSISGEYGGLLSMEDIAKWADKHTDQELPKELAALRDLDEEKNPVVVLMR